MGAKFAQAAQDVGFVSIRNHGVKRELINEIEQGIGLGSELRIILARPKAPFKTQLNIYNRF